MAELVFGSAGTIWNIALQIREAVETVRQNKEECQGIAKRVALNSNILKRLEEETDITKNKAMRDALDDVKKTFEEALELIRRCQKRHFIFGFFLASDTAKELRRVLEEIGYKVNQASFCSNVEGTIATMKVQDAIGDLYKILPSVMQEQGVAAEREVTQHQELRPVKDVTQEQEIVLEKDVTPEQEDIQEKEDTPGQEIIEGFIQFNLSVLNEATNGFSGENIIGRGGFSDIYKGVLPGGQDVAIKKFHFSSDLEGFMFCNEFDICSRIQHKNVVRLIGYCVEVKLSLVNHEGRYVQAEERKTFLVLEYVPNGSLKEITEGTRHIGWSSCFQIVQGIAEGVHYLHEQRIIHSDLTPANILFDDEMRPVIIDFGVSKILDPGIDEIKLSDLTGTVGYMAPEHYSGHQSMKSDVFTFGITLLQTIITVCTRSETRRWYGRNKWDEMLRAAGGLKGLVHPAVQVNELQLTEINTSVEIGLLCTQEKPEDRPTMAQVLQMLRREKELPTPTPKTRSIKARA